MKPSDALPAGTPANRVSARRIVITGASSGLGRALALELAARFPGSTFLLLGRRAERLQELAASLPDAVAVTETADVTDTERLHAVCRQFVEAHGAPDIVIASAGISAGTLTDESEDRAVFERIMAVNVQGTFDTFAPFLDSMKQAGKGTLVGIASVAGVRGLPGSGAYSASKAAVAVYLESLRLEMRAHGIAVVTISPGFIDTEMTRVNPYHMPCLMPAERFARVAVDAILARRRRIVIPWQMGWVARLLRILPAASYDYLFADSPRKPRKPSLGRKDLEG
ncbi:MAG: SDR family oxidoreductase [Lautropia sp.]|nr:SDR family oxidoreductase [Lautropia sp.]